MPETKVRLSSAIRAGCKDSRQVYDRFFDDKDGRDVVGAAIIGAGFPSLAFIHDFRKKYAEDLRKSANCPECGSLSTIEELLSHLNDVHRLPRELIADWIESRDL